MTSRRCAHCGYEITTGGPDSKCPECGGVASTAIESLRQMWIARAASCILIVAIPAWVFASSFEMQEDFIPMERAHALIFAAIAAACALATEAVGYVRFLRLMKWTFVAGALFSILLISARNFDIRNHATIVRTDLLWHVLVWSLRIVFAFTITFGLVVLSNVCRASGYRNRLLTSTATASCAAGALLFATLVGPWAKTALWDASQGMWQPTPPNSLTSPPVPNLIGIQSILECVRLSVLFLALLWMWVLALLCFAVTSLEIGRQPTGDK